MKSRRHARAAILLVVAIPCAWGADRPVAVNGGGSPGSVQQGRLVYQKNCLPCHGLNGDGRGEMGLTVKPRPRDFRLGQFKFRSTPSGSLPTDDDLARTIRGGLTGTAMPVFSALREEEIRDLVAFVKTFSPRWQQPENLVAPLPLPKTPGWFDDADQLPIHAANGRRLFAEACAPCHGPDGDGRGPSAAELKDSRGETIPPSDLRQPLRCGAAPRDIYRTLVTGLDGTPMPSFLDALNDEQLWEIVAHLGDMRRAKRAGASPPQ